MIVRYIYCICLFYDQLAKIPLAGCVAWWVRCATNCSINQKVPKTNSFSVLMATLLSLFDGTRAFQFTRPLQSVSAGAHEKKQQIAKINKYDSLGSRRPVCSVGGQDHCSLYHNRGVHGHWNSGQVVIDQLSL
jgi:hypothetical protein